MNMLHHKILGIVEVDSTIWKNLSNEDKAEIETLCLNSKENFDDNKQYLKKRMEEEENPIIRKLLMQDSTNLDRMQVQMATAREFLIIIRLKNHNESDVFPYLSRIEKSLKDQGFTTRRADNADIKRILGVYFE